MVRKVFTTYQIAGICNVHNTTVINWADSGKLQAYSTPGGHRRVRRDDLVDFMKKHNFPFSEDLGDGRKRVLIVDDDEGALEELKEALGGNDFEVDVASSGFEAGRKIYGRKPDLILLDFRMPGIDGFLVCDILREDRETSDIPVIAVTVLNSEDDIRRIKECGVKGYMEKPVNVEELLETVKNILGDRHITNYGRVT